MSGPDYETLFKSPLEGESGPSRWGSVMGGLLLGVMFLVGLWFLLGRTSPDNEGGEDSVAASTVSSPEVAQTPSSSTSTSPSTTQPTSTSSPAGEQPSDAVEQLDALLDELVPIEEFSGVVLIAKDDQLVWARAAGLADRDSDTPIQVESRFNLASMNKMFTAVSILQLMEEGLLALDGTFAEYLPDFPNPDVAAKISVEQLLTHTSGIAVDVFAGDFELNPHQYRANADYLALFIDEPLQFSPGEQFAYSNAGFIVLGLIIEELTGMGYDEYVYEHIFEPSGMLATGAHDIEDDFADLAIGYTTLDAAGNETGVLRDHRPLMPGRGTAAGGGYSTAGDLHRFRNALFDYRLLSPESVDMLITGQIELRDQAKYALGFFDRIQSGQRVVGHGGGAPGVCASLSMYPDTGYTAIVLSNTDNDCLAVLDSLKTNPPR
jgi:CubicO group peptidase (beta-lactamase class C family)